MGIIVQECYVSNVLEVIKVSDRNGYGYDLGNSCKCSKLLRIANGCGNVEKDSSCSEMDKKVGRVHQENGERVVTGADLNGKFS